MSQSDPAPERPLARLSALGRRFGRLLPYLSLASGIAGGFLMERTPRTAVLVLAAAIFGWAAAMGVVLLGRLDPDAYEGKKRLFVKGARLSALIALQSFIQQNLLFALPLYISAAVLLPGHIAFICLLLVAVAASLWDPLFERVTASAMGRFALTAFAVFAGANALLPMLGLGNGQSLVVGSGIAVLGLFLDPEAPFAGLTAPRRRALLRTLVGGALAISVWLFVGFIPPAPLRLVRGAMGTAYADHEVTDPSHVIEGAASQLVCATAVGAPRGVHDALFHVWRKDGEVVDRIPLVISGGRDSGYRTYSKKTRLGKDPFGTWRCTVETGAGQVLGTLQLVVRPPGG